MTTPPEPENIDPILLRDREILTQHQKEVDAHRNWLISQMTPEEQEKMRIVEKAVADIANAGVACYIFAQLPEPRLEGRSMVVQYNTLAPLVESWAPDARDWKLTEFNYEFFVAYATWFAQTSPFFDRHPLSVVVETNLFQVKCAEAYRWVVKKELRPEVDEMRRKALTSEESTVESSHEENASG